MDIGIIGAGHVGLAVAPPFVNAGHRVKLSGGRGPGALAPVAEGIGAEAASVSDAAASELVLLAIPWPAVPEVLDALPDWQGRILIDATNPFVSFNPLTLADLGGQSSSVIVARHAPGAHVVKAFNAVDMANFTKGPREGTARRVVLIAGDDAASKHTVRDLITELGYAPIDLGGLEDGGRMQQAGGPLAGHDLLVSQ